MPDMTLAEIRSVLAEQVLSFGITTLWRFFKRRWITLKIDGACGGGGSSLVS